MKEVKDFLIIIRSRNIVPLPFDVLIHSFAIILTEVHFYLARNLTCPGCWDEEGTRQSTELDSDSCRQSI